VSAYVKQHPCFYVEEMQTELRASFPGQRKGFSATSLLRLLRHQLGLSRKVLECRAREAFPFKVMTYLAKLRAFYSFPEQVVFLDETPKTGVDARRRLGWSKHGTKSIVRVPFRRDSVCRSWPHAMCTVSLLGSQRMGR